MDITIFDTFLSTLQCIRSFTLRCILTSLRRSYAPYVVIFADNDLTLTTVIPTNYWSMLKETPHLGSFHTKQPFQEASYLVQSLPVFSLRILRVRFLRFEIVWGSMTTFCEENMIFQHQNSNTLSFHTKRQFLNYLANFRSHFIECFIAYKIT